MDKIQSDLDALGGVIYRVFGMKVITVRLYDCNNLSFVTTNAGLTYSWELRSWLYCKSIKMDVVHAGSLTSQ